MIKIITKKNKQGNKEVFLGELIEITTNEALKSVKSGFENIFKDYSCDIHLDKSGGTIIIDTNNPKMEMNYELKDFCCNHFKQEISKSLKK